jgi:pimeloyl-ACP methyl ester carboxylesterase
VPPDHVTVVGASMGAGIALLAAARLQNAEVRFGLLGACLSGSVRRIAAEEGKRPSGRVLSIREGSDETTEPCEAWKSDPEPGPSLIVREIVLHTGLRHGFLYRPLPEWVDPIAEWAVDKR